MLKKEIPLSTLLKEYDRMNGGVLAMEQKWQRIRFMPGTPLGEDGRRVTGSQKHIDLARRAAANRNWAITSNKNRGAAIIITNIRPKMKSWLSQ